jgi:hypothetical protein
MLYHFSHFYTRWSEVQWHIAYVFEGLFTPVVVMAYYTEETGPLVSVKPGVCVMCRSSVTVWVIVWYGVKRISLIGHVSGGRGAEYTHDSAVANRNWYQFINKCCKQHVGRTPEHATCRHINLISNEKQNALTAQQPVRHKGQFKNFKP